jgi:hypothetical protein
LSGALATAVFAFEAAAAAYWSTIEECGSSPSSPITTITCIPIASSSPMIGKLSFETAFKELEYIKEEQSVLFHSTNHFDLFTQLPNASNRTTYLYARVCVM